MHLSNVTNDSVVKFLVEGYYGIILFVDLDKVFDTVGIPYYMLNLFQMIK